MPSWNVKHNIQHDIKNVHVELEWWSSRTFSATLKNADVGLECWARRTFSATLKNADVELEWWSSRTFSATFECWAGTTFSTTCRNKCECRAGMSSWHNVKHDIQKKWECRAGMSSWHNIQHNIKIMRMSSWNIDLAEHSARHSEKNVNVELECWAGTTFSTTLKKCACRDGILI